MRVTFRKQALGDQPHPTCTTSLGPQDAGQVWCCPLHLKGGRGLPGWGPGPLISSLTTGLPCSASPLPASSALQLLPAPPVVATWGAGLCRLRPWWVALGHVFVYPHCDLVLPSSSRHPQGHLTGAAPASPPQGSSGLKSHGPSCQLSPLPPPSCTRLTSRASFLQGGRDQGTRGAPSWHFWASPCSSGQRQLGGGEDVLEISAAGQPGPSGSIQGRSEALSGGTGRC